MKTIREEKIGKATVRLLEHDGGYRGRVFNGDKASDVLDDADPDLLWRRLLNEVGKASPSYFGFEGARNRFLRIFPKGFTDPGFLVEERNYKAAARDLLQKGL